MASIDYVFDDDHVLAADRVAEVFEDLDVAARFGLILVARDRHEIDRHPQVDGTHQIGQKKTRAFENADHNDIAVGVLGRYLGAKFLDAFADLLFGQKDLKIGIDKLRRG